MNIRIMLFVAVAAGVFFAAAVMAQIQTYQITNGVIQTQITSDIGGRVLSFSLIENPNLLTVGEPMVSNPNPVVSPESRSVDYLGHETWIGPQSQWWLNQTLNPRRAAEKAHWPPDPYLVLTKNILLEKSASKLVLQGPESPVSGLMLTKSYSLIAKHKNSIELSVMAKNIRQDSVAWDIWFNTRVGGSTQVYLPIISEKDVRIKLFRNSIQDVFVPIIQNGIFSLNLLGEKGKNFGVMKLLIQPSAGWMVGFRGEQAFIIQFEHQPLTEIHPEHGQIELYFDFSTDKINERIMEMEVHAPYKTLDAGTEMVAKEIWTVLPYHGKNNREAHLKFLRKQSKKLGLKGL